MLLISLETGTQSSTVLEGSRWRISNFVNAQDLMWADETDDKGIAYVKEACDDSAGAPAKAHGHQPILLPSLLFPDRFSVQGRLLPTVENHPVWENILSNIVLQILIYAGKKPPKYQYTVSSHPPTGSSVTFRVVVIVLSQAWTSVKSLSLFFLEPHESPLAPQHPWLPMELQSQGQDGLAEDRER